MTKTYIGAKIVTAWPASHVDNDEPGYAVRYADGYTSWSPKDVFEEAYIEVPEAAAPAILERARAAIKGGNPVNASGAGDTFDRADIIWRETALHREQALRMAVETANRGETATSVVDRARRFADFILHGRSEAVAEDWPAGETTPLYRLSGVELEAIEAALGGGAAEKIKALGFIRAAREECDLIHSAVPEAGA